MNCHVHNPAFAREFQRLFLAEHFVQKSGVKLTPGPIIYRAGENYYLKFEYTAKGDERGKFYGDRELEHWYIGINDARYNTLMFNTGVTFADSAWRIPTVAIGVKPIDSATKDDVFSLFEFVDEFETFLSILSVSPSFYFQCVPDDMMIFHCDSGIRTRLVDFLDDIHSKQEQLEMRLIRNEIKGAVLSVSTKFGKKIKPIQDAVETALSAIKVIFNSVNEENIRTYGKLCAGTLKRNKYTKDIADLQIATRRLIDFSSEAMDFCEEYDKCVKAMEGVSDYFLCCGPTIRMTEGNKDYIISRLEYYVNKMLK